MDELRGAKAPFFPSLRGEKGVGAEGGGTAGIRGARRPSPLAVQDGETKARPKG